MKKKILYLFVFMGLLGIKGALPTDNAFDISVRSDNIVGSLWHGSEIPQENLREFFKLIKVENREPNKKEYNNAKIDSIIDAYQKSLQQTANHREESGDKIANLDNFIGNIYILKSEFPPQAIASGLRLISSKYDG